MMEKKTATAKGASCRALALAWFAHRRFESLTPPLGIERITLTTRARKPLRELILSLRTFKLLLARRPQTVLVQNPSMVSTLLIVLLRPLFGYRIMVDAHGDAVIPYTHNRWWVRAVSYWLLRQTELTLVTNESLARRVREHGGRPFVLFDNLPQVPVLPSKVLGKGKHVMFISTYAADEPHEELFAAATRLKTEGVTIYVTGRIRPDRMADLPPPPPNVVLTGFLGEHEYWELLLSCNVIVDLTTMPDCLVCGAYEAVAAQRALVLSDNTPSRELFEAAAIYTRNDAASIATSIDIALARQEELESAAAIRSAHLRGLWDSKAMELKRRLEATR